MKNYNQAPLPFQGQKRKFIKSFKEALKSFQSDAIYVDLFGGSGLLSHAVKQVYPNTRVIWNDFDNYSERLANISKTNKLINDLREIIGDYTRKTMITPPLKTLILEKIKKEEGFVDYITLSSSLLFSAKYVTDFEGLEKETLYNNIKRNDYNADDYLQGVEIVSKDYKKLFADFKDEGNVVFLCDPPYLSTDVSSYNSKSYWRLNDYLDVLKVLDGTRYFYFTSEKSEIIELAQWMSENGFKRSPFDGAKIEIISTTLNHTAKYNDIMIYK